MIHTVPSFIINLDTCPEKWQKSSSLLKSIGLTPQRFPAVYGKSIDPSYLQSIIHPSVDYTIKHGRSTDDQIQGLGAIGCYLSHLKLWEMLLESKNEMFLIFEDDLYPTNVNLYELESYVMDVITNQPDWDVIYLGFYKPLPYGSQDVKLSDTVYQINEITFTTHSYLLHRRGAQKLLKHAFPIIHQVDSYLSYMASRGDLKSFRSSKPFFYQNTTFSASSIQEGCLRSVKTIITRFRNETILYSIILIILVITVLLILVFRKNK